MREIKFRAWEKNEKVLAPVMEINFDDKVVQLPIGDSSWGSHFDQVELMQYTGLKDKNGVEIYEGDIVRAGTVESGDGAVKDMNVPVEYARGVFEPVAYVTDDVLEVIGNIYESPELLEQNN